MLAHQAEFAGVDTAPLVATLAELAPVRIEAVDRTPLEPLWDELMRSRHYLGHKKMLGARLKQLAFAGERPIAALGWRSAALKLAGRDRFIGWSLEQKRHFLPHLANNNRFLVFDWVRVKNLASHVLARAMRALARDWQAKYGRELWLLETFVDPQHFSGTAYLAANWLRLGPTKGFTKQGQSYLYHGHAKEVFVYVVKPEFRKLIGCQEKPPCPQAPLRPSQTSKTSEEAVNVLAHQNDWQPGILAENGITPERIDTLAEVLIDFHKAFAKAFSRSDQRFYHLTLLKGLLSNLESKSLEPMALRYLSAERVRALQRFVTSSPWDDALLGALYRERLANSLAAETAQQGVLTLDSSEFPKKGKESAGVARQYCGRLGKRENCQSGVFVGYSSEKGYGLVDSRLYLPKLWFEESYAERRKNCGIPEELSFASKPRIGLELLNEVLAEGHFKARWLACDEGFGASQAFRQEVGELGLYYFAAVRATTQLFPEWPEIGLPNYQGRGPRPSKVRPLTQPVTARELATDPDTSWQEATLAEGAKGPSHARIARRRVVLAKEGLPQEELWLFIRQDGDDQAENGKRHYFLSNAPKDTPLEAMTKICTMRWPIEQSLEEAKSQLGMDHYEHRSWRGWHRYMLHVFMAMLFLLEVRQHFKKGALPSPF